MSTSNWKPIEERIKAPKGTKTVNIDWNEFNKIDTKTFFTKWQAAEYVATHNKKVIYRLPNGTYAVNK